MIPGRMRRDVPDASLPVARDAAVREGGSARAGALDSAGP